MGVLGFLPTMVLLVGFQWKGWSSLRSFHQQPEALFLYVLLLAQLVASVFGCLNLLLESPFLASIYWVILGVGMRVMSLLGREASFGFLPQGASSGANCRI
jgi:hypothetical protein